MGLIITNIINNSNYKTNLIKINKENKCELNYGTKRCKIKDRGI